MKPQDEATYLITIPHARAHAVRALLKTSQDIEFSPKDDVCVVPEDDAFERGAFRGVDGQKLIDTINRGIAEESTVYHGAKPPLISACWEDLDCKNRADLLKFAASSLDFPSGACRGIDFAEWRQFLKERPTLTEGGAG